MAAALDEREARATRLLLEEFGPRAMAAAPGEVLGALERADVGVLCMAPQPGELAARMAIVEVVERRQIRYAHMVGVTPEIMQQGMRADYRMVDRLSEKLRERLLGAETLRVKTEAGTEVAGHFERRLDLVENSGLIDPRYLSHMPAGEGFSKPANAGCTVVCDSSVGGHLFSA